MLIHWIWLATRSGINDRQKALLLESFRDPEEIYFADAAAYDRVEGLSKEGREALEDKNLEDAEEIYQTCIDKDIRLCTFHDGAYPSALKNIPDPPVLLYCVGSMPDFDGSPVIGVVGTRKASVYGLNVAVRMGFQIARCGGIVVSGVADGIDGEAMKGALTAGGCTVGILGCGVDVVYPASNRALYADTIRHGCLISEFPPGTPPYKWNFPKRNRIISGISNGVLIVEAPEKSGSLITARRAADQGRDVFVVPGNIDVDTCVGSNALLRDGAISVSSGWDVISEYQALYPDKIRMDTRPVKLTANAGEGTPAALQPEKSAPKVAQKRGDFGKTRISDKRKGKEPIDNSESQGYIDHGSKMDLTDEEQQLISVIREGMLLDDAIVASGLPTGKVLCIMTNLQIKGYVKQLPGKRLSLNQ